VSDGTATLRTGDVNVSGASGPNVIDQSSNVGRGGINTGDQTARIDNDTNVRANTGGNTVIGNASRNTNIVDQDAVSLGGRAAPAATAAAAAGVYGVEGELDAAGQPTALFNKMGEGPDVVQVDPNADVNNPGVAEANTGPNTPDPGLLGHGGGHSGGMTPANAPLDGSIDGMLPGGPPTPLWDPSMGTTPTPPADPAPMPSPSGHPSPMPTPSPTGQPDDSYQHSPLSPAPGGQSHSGVDATVDAALAQVDGAVDGLHAGYGAGGADHYDGTQLAQAGVVDDEDDWGGSSVPAPEPSPPITHGGGTGALVDDDDDWGAGAHGSADPSPAPSPMPSPDPAPSPHASPMPSPAPADPDGLDDYDTFDKRNEHSSMDHDDDVMDHDDLDDIG
jgi:hypothetical protein